MEKMLERAAWAAGAAPGGLEFEPTLQLTRLETVTEALFAIFAAAQRR